MTLYMVNLNSPFESMNTNWCKEYMWYCVIDYGISNIYVISLICIHTYNYLIDLLLNSYVWPLLSLAETWLSDWWETDGVYHVLRMFQVSVTDFIPRHLPFITTSPCKLSNNNFSLGNYSTFTNENKRHYVLFPNKSLNKCLRYYVIWVWLILTSL